MVQTPQQTHDFCAYMVFVASIYWLSTCVVDSVDIGKFNPLTNQILWRGTKKNDSAVDKYLIIWYSIFISECCYQNLIVHCDILLRDLGYVTPSDLNTQCVHGEPGMAKTVKYYTQCYYEAFVRIHILRYLGLNSTGFLPPPSQWKNCAPTWNDSTYRHEIMEEWEG